ncbi:MAG TPA: hypothetical protein VFL59_07695 [Candidatus Nanopelagicales bacterium]|nr:hypothetical protein [Candidatus Nanopelagicales bacterium]
MPPSSQRHPSALLAAAALVLTACAGPSAAAPGPVPPQPVPSTSSAAPSASIASSTAGSVSAVQPARIAPDRLRWSVVWGRRSLQVAHDGAVSFLWMDPSALRFRFVPGTRVPEGSPVSAADRAPSTWTSGMLAAFDSGYKLRDHVGGYRYLGRTVAPLRPGLGAFSISSDGTLSVGVWGRDLTLSSSTVVVRENLRPLVVGGAVQASPSDSARTWGIANGNAPQVNRSALGRLADGSLVFEFGHDVTAWQMARALASIGAVDAVMLDMNRSWPTGFVYRPGSAGRDGRRIDPGIVRSPSTYLQRFTKDFVVVSAR